ncbi:MAG: hypothetical protein KGM47_01580 [Acidobacteriota bacterium]|nr:hypothetical protein [Acidobacteriota bacterium]
MPLSNSVYYLGIDGGGSRTTAWVGDDRKRTLARATGGPGNPVKVGIDCALRNILEAAHIAQRKARLRGQEFEAICAGIAGAGRPSSDRLLLSKLRSGLRARRYILTTDGLIALECALGQSAGVIVISGTGSIAYGRGPDRQVLRCGGWGSVFDDAGSGYEIARRAVAAALRAIDGRGRPTRLGVTLCRALRITHITQVAGMALRPDEIAALFPSVLRAARAGDPEAKRIIHEAGIALAEMAAAILCRMSKPGNSPRVVCAGGVFRSSLAVRRSFAAHLGQSGAHAKVELLRREPVEGALSLARAADGDLGLVNGGPTCQR